MEGLGCGGAAVAVGDFEKQTDGILKFFAGDVNPAEREFGLHVEQTLVARRDGRQLAVSLVEAAELVEGHAAIAAGFVGTIATGEFGETRSARSRQRRHWCKRAADSTAWTHAIERNDSLAVRSSIAAASRSSAAANCWR